MPADPKPSDTITVDNASDYMADDEWLKKFVIPPEAFEQRGVCFGFVAPAGAGKTTLAGANIESEEYGGRTMVIDMEAGSKVLPVNDPLLTIVRIVRWQDLDQLTSRFIAGKYPEFRGVVLDNFCEIQKANMSTLAAPGTDIQIRNWMQNTDNMKHFIRRWRDYADAHNVNVFITAWDDEEERKITNRVSVQSTPSIQKEFPGLFDTIGFINKINNQPDLRELDFTPSMNTIAKMRRGKNSNAMKIPYKIRYDIDTLPMADMLATIKGGVAWPAAKYAAFDKRINQ